MKTSPPPMLKGNGDHYIITISKDEADRRGLREGEPVSIGVWKKQSRLKHAKPAERLKHVYNVNQTDYWRRDPRAVAAWLKKILESIVPHTGVLQRRHGEGRVSSQALLDNLNDTYSDGPSADERQLMDALHRQASYVLHRHE